MMGSLVKGSAMEMAHIVLTEYIDTSGNGSRIRFGERESSIVVKSCSSRETLKKD